MTGYAPLDEALARLVAAQRAYEAAQAAETIARNMTILAYDEVHQAQIKLDGVVAAAYLQANLPKDGC